MNIDSSQNSDSIRNTMTAKSSLSKALAFTINFLCFCFAISKSIECLAKYSQFPKGTNVGV